MVLGKGQEGPLNSGASGCADPEGSRGRGPGDSNGSGVGCAVERAAPHAGSRRRHGETPLNAQRLEQRGRPGSAGPQGRRLRAPAAQDEVVPGGPAGRAATPPCPLVCEVFKWFSSLRGAIVRSLPPSNTPFLGPHFQTARGWGGRTCSTRPSKPRPSLLCSWVSDAAVSAGPGDAQLCCV